MINLATLIGANNLQRLIDRATNTHVVIEKDGEFDYIKKTNSVDYANVIGIGSYRSCRSLTKYLNLQKNAS